MSIDVIFCVLRATSAEAIECGTFRIRVGEMFLLAQSHTLLSLFELCSIFFAIIFYLRGFGSVAHLSQQWVYRLHPPTSEIGPTKFQTESVAKNLSNFPGFRIRIGCSLPRSTCRNCMAHPDDRKTTTVMYVAMMFAQLHRNQCLDCWLRH